MPFKDSSTAGGKVRVKTSMVAGEAIVAAGLATGELALNAADGAMYFRNSAGGVGRFPSATGFTQIVTLTQAAYDALSPKVAATLYIVTAS